MRKSYLVILCSIIMLMLLPFLVNANVNDSLVCVGGVTNSVTNWTVQDTSCTNGRYYAEITNITQGFGKWLNLTNVAITFNESGLFNRSGFANNGGAHYNYWNNVNITTNATNLFWTQYYTGYQQNTTWNKVNIQRLAGLSKNVNTEPQQFIINESRITNSMTIADNGMRRLIWRNTEISDGYQDAITAYNNENATYYGMNFTRIMHRAAYADNGGLYKVNFTKTIVTNTTEGIYFSAISTSKTNPTIFVDDMKCYNISQSGTGSYNGNASCIYAVGAQNISINNVIGVKVRTAVIEFNGQVQGAYVTNIRGNDSKNVIKSYQNRLNYFDNITAYHQNDATNGAINIDQTNDTTVNKAYCYNINRTCAFVSEGTRNNITNLEVMCDDNRQGGDTLDGCAAIMTNGLADRFINISGSVIDYGIDLNPMDYLVPGATGEYCGNNFVDNVTFTVHGDANRAKDNEVYGIRLDYRAQNTHGYCENNSINNARITSCDYTNTGICYGFVTEGQRNTNITNSLARNIKGYGIATTNNNSLTRIINFTFINNTAGLVYAEKNSSIILVNPTSDTNLRTNNTIIGNGSTMYVAYFGRFRVLNGGTPVPNAVWNTSTVFLNNPIITLNGTTDTNGLSNITEFLSYKVNATGIYNVSNYTVNVTLNDGTRKTFNISFTSSATNDLELGSNVTIAIGAYDSELSSLVLGDRWLLDGISFNIVNGVFYRTFTTSGDGLVSYNIPSGTYNITLEGGRLLYGYTYDTITYSNVAITSDADYKLPSYGATVNINLTKIVSHSHINGFNVTVTFPNLSEKRFGNTIIVAAITKSYQYTSLTNNITIHPVACDPGYACLTSEGSDLFRGSFYLDVTPTNSINHIITDFNYDAVNGNLRVGTTHSLIYNFSDCNISINATDSLTGAPLLFNYSLSNSSYSYSQTGQDNGSGVIQAEQNVMYTLNVNSAGYTGAIKYFVGNSTNQVFSLSLNDVGVYYPTTPDFFAPISGTDRSGSSVDVYFNTSHHSNLSVNYSLFGSNARFNQSLIYYGTQNNYSWTNLNDDRYFLTVQATDTAGGSSANSSTINFSITNNVSFKLRTLYNQYYYPEFIMFSNVTLSNGVFRFNNFSTGNPPYYVFFSNLPKGYYNVSIEADNTKVSASGISTEEIMPNKFQVYLNDSLQYINYSLYGVIVNVTTHKMVSSQIISSKTNFTLDDIQPGQFNGNNYLDYLTTLSSGNITLYLKIPGSWTDANNGAYNYSPWVTMNKSGYFPTRFMLSNWVTRWNTTQQVHANISDNNFTVILRDYFTGDSIQGFTANVTQSSYSYSQSKMTSLSNVTFSLEQGLPYTFILSKSGYAINTEGLSVTGNSTFQNFTFYGVASNGSAALINVYDENTGLPLNMVAPTGTLVNLEFISTISASNYSTTSALNVSSLIPGGYQIRYSADGYRPRDYYINIANGSFLPINLYLLNSSLSSFIPMLVTDTSSVPLENSTVKALRYFLAQNAYVVVAMTRTDENGISNFDLVPNTVQYAFIIAYNGRTVLVSTPRKITGSQLAFNVNLVDSPLTGYYIQDSVQDNLTWDNATKTFTYTYNDVTNKLINGRLKVVKSSVLHGETTICDNSVYSSSGSIECTVTDEANSLYFATAFVHTNTTSSEYIRRTYQAYVLPNLNAKTTFGALGVFLVFIMCAFVFFLSRGIGSISLVLVMAVILVSSLIGLIGIEWGSIVIFALGMIYVISRSE